MSSICVNTEAYLQTPHGKGGIAVVVVKGPGTGFALSQIFQPLTSHADGGQGILQLGHILSAKTVVDEAIVHVGAASVEINIHGGPLAAQAVMDLLEVIGIKATSAPAADATFDPAHPEVKNPAIGVEMFNCLPKARSSMVMAALTQQWSSGVSKLARQVLAEIDRGGGAALPCVGGLRRAADSYTTMQRLLEPPRVVLAGPPNAGKSTLANTLVGRAVSIVHETPGTTRDWVTELALIQGVPIMLTDTAGIWDPRTKEDAESRLRQTTATPSQARRRPPRRVNSVAEKQLDGCDRLIHAVDLEAAGRAQEQISQADIVLLLVNEDGGEHVQAAGRLIGSDAKVIRVWAKADAKTPRGDFDVAVSAASGEGMEQLGHEILQTLRLFNFDPCEPHAFTARQVGLLRASAQAIEHGQMALAGNNLTQMLVGC